MKIYRSSRVLLEEAECVLSSRRHGAGVPPLTQVLESLVAGRHYKALQVSINQGDQLLPLAKAGAEHTFSNAIPSNLQSDARALAVPIRTAGNSIGVLSVESSRPNGLSRQEQLFLREVAGTIARYLLREGKPLVRHARQERFAPVPQKPSQSAMSMVAARRVAAGEKSR